MNTIFKISVCYKEKKISWKHPKCPRTSKQLGEMMAYPYTRTFMQPLKTMFTKNFNDQ